MIDKTVPGFDLASEMLCSLDPLYGTPTKLLAEDFGIAKVKAVVALIATALGKHDIGYERTHAGGYHCIIIAPKDRERLERANESYWSYTYGTK